MSNILNQELRDYRKKIEEYQMVLHIDEQIKNGEKNMDNRPLLTEDDIKDINMKIHILSDMRDKLLSEDNGYKDIIL